MAKQRWGVLVAPTRPDDDDDDEFDLTEDRGDQVTEEETAWWQRALVFGREHLAVLAVALAIGTVFGVTTYLRARPQEVPLPPPTSVVTIDAPETQEPTPQQIKVHMLGALNAPGVVTLPLGARVEDAIAAAGGLADDADPAQLNLAALVADGSQIIIGTKDDPRGDINGATAAGGSAGGLVNLNTASEAELETLPGIGPVTAQKILAWRAEHGRFTAVAELQEVSGIGPKTLAQLEPYVCI